MTALSFLLLAGIVILVAILVIEAYYERKDK